MRHPAAVVAWCTAALVLILDQLTKLWAVATLEGQPDRQIIGDLLRFSFVRNPGAAFGLGGGATIIFSLIAIVVTVVLFRMSTRLTSLWWGIALGLMLGRKAEPAVQTALAAVTETHSVTAAVAGVLEAVDQVGRGRR